MNAAEQLSSNYIASYPQEAANILQTFPAREVVEFLREQSVSIIALVLDHSIPYISAGYLDALEPDLAAKAMVTLTPEHAIPPLRHLSESARERVLDSLPETVGRSYRILLQWPSGTAGAAMNPFLLVLTEDMTVSEAMKRARSERKTAFYFPYVVDKQQRLVGTLSVRALMQANPKQTLKDIVYQNGPQILGSTPLEHVIQKMDWKSFDSIPVVDEEGILLGAILRETLEKAASHASALQANTPLADGLLNLGELYGRTAIELVPLIAQTALGIKTVRETQRRNDHD